jgi:hypothetical protein
MYAGVNGEFIELTNLSGQPIDFTGWSLDDDHAVPGAFALAALGTVAPGESIVVTDGVAGDFRTAWSLAAGVKVLGQLGVASGNNLGRADQIHLTTRAAYWKTTSITATRPIPAASARRMRAVRCRVPRLRRTRSWPGSCPWSATSTVLAHRPQRMSARRAASRWSAAQVRTRSFADSFETP